jgi:hypothetical protein
MAAGTQAGVTEAMLDEVLPLPPPHAVSITKTRDSSKA